MLHTDISTLFVTAIFTSVILAITLGFVARDDRMSPLRPWTAGLVLHTLAYLLLMLRGQIADLLSIVIANALESAFIACWSVSLARLAHRPVRATWLIAPPLLIALDCLIFIATPNPRIIIGSLILLAQLGFMLYQLKDLNQPGRNLGQTFLKICLLVTGLLLVIRIFVLATGMMQFVDITTPSTAHTLIYLSGSIIPVVGSLGFLIMLKEHADRQIQESKHLLTTIFDSAQETIAMFDRDGTFLAINQLGATRFNMSPAQMIGMNLSDVVPEEIAAHRLAAIQRVASSGKTELLTDRRAGRIYLQNFYPVEGESNRVVVFASDITEKLSADEALAASEEKFRTIFDTINDAIFIHDAETGRILDVNVRATTMYGYTREQLLSISIDKLSADGAPYDKNAIQTVLDQCNANGWHAFEWHARDSGGRLFWVAVNLQLMKLGNQSRIMAVVRDIDGRKKDEEALRAALRVIEASPVVSYRLIDVDSETPKLDYVSANVSRWGYAIADLLAGQPHILDLIHPDDRARVLKEMAIFAHTGVSEASQEYRLRAANGKFSWVQDRMHIVRDQTGKVVSHEGLIADIEAEKQAELQTEAALAAQRELNKKLEAANNQLLQSEKMASIGQLAAGVAHELNNPIGFVSSNLGTLKNYIDDIFQIAAICETAAEQAANPDDFARIQAVKAEKDFDYLKSDIYQLLAESTDGLQRVKKIVQDLKDFSRPGESNWQWSDVHKGIDSTLNIVWNELKYNCTVTKNYGQIPEIYCLPSQLNQVFMNLLVNAAHAIEGKGEITIATEMSDTDHVVIRFSDTGKGIQPEHLNRLFDPFFTTKPVGKGTGLGLSIAWGIINKHHGKIEVSSVLGKGTTFTITLPVEPQVDTDPANQPPTTSAEQSS